MLTPPPSHEACLFAAVTTDCPSLVKPFSARLYLVDFEREIIVCPYDDRGMDLIANKATNLQPLFNRFHDWLLVYDLPRMEAVFGSQ